MTQITNVAVTNRAGSDVNWALQRPVVEAGDAAANPRADLESGTPMARNVPTFPRLPPAIQR
jgi:hypothetical protein